MANARTEHSRMGIASFVSAVLSGLSLTGLVLVGVNLRYLNPPGDPLAQGLWLLIPALLAICFALVGLGFGIVGALQRRRKKLFAFLGIAWSIVVLAAVFILNALLPA